MNRVVIVHGYTDNPSSNWTPWLKQELERRGVEVVVPLMPLTYTPTLSRWLPFLQEIVGSVDEETYFIGHSLGCPTILRLLERLPEGQHAGGCILVAGFAEPIRLKRLDSFTKNEWDDEKIKRSVNNIVLINSDNDPYIPLEIGTRMRDRLDAKLIIKHDAGHINRKSGHETVPFVFAEIEAMLGLT